METFGGRTRPPEASVALESWVFGVTAVYGYRTDNALVYWLMIYMDYGLDFLL